MYDKLDLRIDPRVSPTPLLESILEDADRPRAAGDASPWRASEFYQRTASLEGYGVPAILHWGCRSGKLPTHKLEILQAGGKPVGEIKDITRSLFCMDAEDAGVMRIDLTADVTTAGVGYFRRNCVVMAKQTHREFGGPSADLEWAYQTVAKGQAETLYAGVRPNQLMVYDKTRQRMALTMKEKNQVARMNRKAMEEACTTGADEMPPELQARTFQERWGYDPEKMVTRVELAVAGKKLEHFGLSRLHHIWKLDEVEPFGIIRFLNDRQAVLDRADWSWEDWMIGQHLRAMMKADGAGAVRRYMYGEIGNKSFYKNWAKFLPFLQTGDRSCTYQMLQDAFVKSTREQLWAA